MQQLPNDAPDRHHRTDPQQSLARGRRRRRRNLLAATLLVAAPAAAQPPIFSDGFESGDTSAWSATVPPPAACASGLGPGSTLGGDLGPAPGGAFVELACLEVRNDRPFERREVAFSGVPLPGALGLLDTAALTLVGPGDRRIAAQLDVLSRWGGVRDNPALPIRWLQVAAPVRVAAAGPGGPGVTRYSLRRYTPLAPPVDPFAATITPAGGGFEVDTGLATFVVDPTNPALLSSIAVDLDDDGSGRTTVYTHTAGAGPRLVFDAAGTDVTLSTAGAGEVVVDAGSFEIVESGPARVAVALRGHFADGLGRSLCTSAGVTAYERFGFTVVLAFERASRDLAVELELRNECSDAFFQPFYDDEVTVRRMSWELPLALGTVTSHFGATTVGSSAPGFGGETVVEQGRGGGRPYLRLAEARLGGVVQQSAEAFALPIVGLAGDDLLATAQLPWMRYREPQAVAAVGSTLSLRFVSTTLALGEAKGIWNHARVTLTPLAALEGGVATHLDSQRALEAARLERGLLLLAPRASVNASGVFPSLGTAAPSAMKGEYLAWIEALHAETVDPGGQFDLARRYGSQLWPDTGGNDPFGIAAEIPNESRGGMNYWDPAGAELVELLRSGDPRWAWDLALPAYWTQAMAAYLNIGFRTHGNRNGVAVQSGGPGCPIDPDTLEVLPCTADGTGGGMWHRTNFGSDDYTYAMGIELGYAVRPSLLLRDRFAQAGANLVARYSIPQAQQATREQFVNQVDVDRQVIQHFEMLANCAEYVPGATGQACHDKLMEVYDELAEDNLAAGVICVGDAVAFTPPASCFSPQQFMTNALFYPFFHRLWRNYGDPPSGSVERLLVESSLALYQYGMEKLPDGVAIDPDGDWAAAMECTLDGTGTVVTSCVPAPDGEGNLAMYRYNKPHAAALLLMAHEVDPSIGLCGRVRAVYDAPGFAQMLGDVGHFVPVGWWKGVSQMMQSLAFGVGIADTCGNPP